MLNTCLTCVLHVRCTCAPHALSVPCTARLELAGVLLPVVDVEATPVLVEEPVPEQDVDELRPVLLRPARALDNRMRGERTAVRGSRVDCPAPELREVSNEQVVRHAQLRGGVDRLAVVEHRLMQFDPAHEARVRSSGRCREVVRLCVMCSLRRPPPLSQLGDLPSHSNRPWGIASFASRTSCSRTWRCVARYRAIST